MADVSIKAGQIAGGLECTSRTVICGGSEKIVGENVTWFMRDRFYELKYASDNNYAPNITDKELLKIIGLKIPLNFDRKKYYDDSKSIIECKEETKIESDIHEKTLYVLKERLLESPTTTFKRLVLLFELQHPLFWSMSQFIRYLAFLHKKHKKNKRRIQITHDLVPLVEQVWNGKNYFNYVINKPDAPSNMNELIRKIFDGLEKTNIKKGNWEEPILKKPEWVYISKEDKGKLETLFEKEKDNMEKRLKGKKNVEETKEYVLAILNMESHLTPYLEKMENYYIEHAENISALLKSLKKYFNSV